MASFQEMVCEAVASELDPALEALEAARGSRTGGSDQGLALEALKVASSRVGLPSERHAAWACIGVQVWRDLRGFGCIYIH